MDYLDQESGEKFIPHIIESSGGVERLFFAIMTEAYTEDELGGGDQVFLKFKPSIAPVKVAVFRCLKISRSW